MKTDTSQKIIAYLEERKESTAKEITDYLDISARAVFKQLNNLLEKKEIIKYGTPPVVFYSLSTKTPAAPQYDLSPEIIRIIDDNYLTINPRGVLLEGMAGFSYWCEKNKLPVEKTAKEYISTLKKYQRFRKNGLINGMLKIKATFAGTLIDKIYYLDFYSIERFGKTKLGVLLLYAKQSQNIKLIKIIVKITKDQIFQLVKQEKIDVIGFIPPTVSRKVQFIKELEKQLAINLPKIKIAKATSGIAVPQKTLNKLNDRIDNAKNTIFLPDQAPSKNVLLIDDAVGSGATFNETAKKIKEKKLAKKIICLALTGSFKGFDVISEV